MTYADDLKNSTHDDIKALATKHGSWETFWQDVQRLAEKAWHNARAQGHDPSSVVGDTKNEPAEGAQVEAGPVDDGEQVSQPAEPASPVSDGGYPTTNVDVVEAPVNVVPPESHPA